MLVYRIGAEPIELDRSQCWFFDRSRMMTGQACPKKRELQYHWNGTGVESAYPADELELGSAVHAGLEVLLREQFLLDEPDYTGSQADLIVSAAEEAKMKMLESGKRGLSIQDNDLFGETAPEIAQLLIEEQANLAYALVWTFGRRRLASLLERYEVVAVEPEICWLVGWTEPQTTEVKIRGVEIFTDPVAIVMMSRPDAVLRSREDGKLRTVSWKTSKRFDQEYLEKLECDVQGITEGLAVQAMYGEEVGGSFYGYLIKGDKKFEPEIGMKRYTSSLIRPYSNWAGIGEPQFKAAYEWINDAGEKKRLGKGWSKVDIWKQQEMASWLEVLDGGVVQPEASRDWLGEVVAEPLPQPFKASEAERWIATTVQEEARWVDGELLRAKHTGNCHSWGRKCQFWRTCWEGASIESEIANGRKRLRTPNHAMEVEDAT
jgi:hypothetical protein